MSGSVSGAAEPFGLSIRSVNATLGADGSGKFVRSAGEHLREEFAALLQTYGGPLVPRGGCAHQAAKRKRAACQRSVGFRLFAG